MQKRGVSASIKGLSLLQISLLISMTFAFSFLLSNEIKFVEASTIVQFTADTSLPGVEYSSLKSMSQSILNIPGGVSPAGVDSAAELLAKSKTILPGTAAVAGTSSYSAKLGWWKLSHTTTSWSLGHLYTGVGHAFIAAAIVGLAARLFGADAATSNALSIAAAAGVAAYQLSLGLAGYTTALGAGSAGAAATISALANIPAGATLTTSGGLISWTAGTGAAATSGTVTLTGLSPGAVTAVSEAAAATGATGTKVAGAAAAKTGIGAYALPIAIGVAIVAFVILYKKVKQQLVTFQCLPWEPPLGGNKCEECNKDPLRPCSEYRCKSLGQACQLLNPNTDNAQCAWVNRGDTQSPTISQWNEALRPTSMQYSANSALRPGARGVKIVNPAAADGCLPAFTALQFGVTTNEPAQCKIDYNRSVSFDSMEFFMGGDNQYQYNHSQKIRLPNPSDPDLDLGPILQNDGTFAFFIRCRDVNGNVNVDEYSINYCVAPGPDTTPPIIEGSSLEDGSPVRFGADTVPIEIYTNEPAQCKWSINDKAYKDMENFLGCAQDASQINANLQYTCIGELTGVKNTPTGNDFYFRCEDQPTLPENDRNQMLQSYKISLRGTEPLSLLRLAPNATTITANTNSVEAILTAETDDGADNGVATCYFSPTGQEGTFVEYYETDSITHSQTLALSAGNYTYFTRCVDLGGNAASGNVSFSVTVDKDMPAVTRIYKVGTDILQLITNEPAECFYSRTSCNYETDEGLRFGYPAAGSDKMHVAGWNSNAPYYVKCRDPYGNEPSPNACSIIVNGVDLSVTATAG